MMNKPAPKEPSMDEILSSIRQIIADDDGAAPKRPTLVGGPAETSPPVADVPATSASPPAVEAAEEAPLSLSAAQILGTPGPAGDDLDLAAFAAEGEGAASKGGFIDPDDVGFEPDASAEIVAPEPEPEPVSVRAPAPRPAPAAVAPAPQAPRPRPTAAQAAPMPDPQLSADIAEQLLAPTTDAAVRMNFARLNNLGVGTPGLTIEAMMRDMLRPMLKEWLDEHLPAVVERMVEKEIARISRGLD
jgi:cell pole-organizing protein PopZ